MIIQRIILRRIPSFRGYATSPTPTTSTIIAGYEALLKKYRLLNLSGDQISQAAAAQGPAVWMSNITDPYVNLALETYLFNSKPTTTTDDDDHHQISNNRLFLYQNSQCVVFGKNQNPWKEIDFGYLKQQDKLSFGSSPTDHHRHQASSSSSSSSSSNDTGKFEVLRRMSGGGTVIHGPGNVNYCFITTKKAFDRTAFSKLIVQELNTIYSSAPEHDNPTNKIYPKYPLTINDRGDLVAWDPQNHRELKVSGSAYKVSRGKSYHHGTMLLHCDLSTFHNILNPKKSLTNGNNNHDDFIIDKSVDSKRAPVVNLQIEPLIFYYSLINGFIANFGVPKSTLLQLNPNIPPQFMQDLVVGMSSHHHEKIIPVPHNNPELNQSAATLVIVDDSTNFPPEVHEIADQLRSWEFKFERTPKFEHVVNKLALKLVVEKSRVIELSEIGILQDNDVSSAITKIRNVLAKSPENSIEYDGETLSQFFENPKTKQYIRSIIV